VRTAFGSSNLGYTGVDIVGIFDVADRADRYWLDDPQLDAPLVERVSLEIRIYHAVALVSPDAYPVLHGAQPGSSSQDVEFPFRYGWRFFLDPARVTAGRLGDVSAALTRLQAANPFGADAFGSGGTSLRTGLPDVIERYVAQRATSEAALAVAAIGPASAAAGALGLVALIQARRRRTAARLVQGRGAPASHLLAAQLVEGLLVCVPAAVIGGAAAILALPGGSILAPVAAAALVAVAAIALLLVAIVPDARAPAGSPVAGGGREGPTSLRASPRRLVLEALIAVVAVLGVVSLRSRGLIGADARDGFDPYLAAVPLLVGVAAAIVAQRLYPLPIRALAWFGSSLRGLVPALALRNAARETSGANLPLLVLLLATAMGVFSSLLLVTVDRGQGVAAWQEVGADFRVDVIASDVLPGLDPLAIPGIEATAAALVQPARFEGGSIRNNPVTLHALDAPSYNAVVAGTPADPGLPTAFVNRTWDPETTGRGQDRIPALVSADLVARSGVGQGGTFTISVSGGERAFSVAGIRERFPGLPLGQPFVVLPSAALRVAFPDASISNTRLYVRGAPEAIAPLREAATVYGSQLHIEAREEHRARLRDSPLMQAVSQGFVLALAVALGYAALALAAALTLSLAARRRQLALLRTLGLHGRHVAGLVLLEHTPMVLLALAGGVLLGLGIGVLITPDLGLQAFMGPTGDVRLHVDPLPVVLLGVAPIAVVMAAVLAATWLVQRADLARTVRMTEQ
jgi:putative ABC transport system permease protein